LYNKLLRQIAKEIAPQCFAKHIVDSEKEQKGIDDTQAAFVAGCKSNPQLSLFGLFC
jgi:hypothetical protein